LLLLLVLLLVLLVLLVLLLLLLPLLLCKFPSSPPSHDYSVVSALGMQKIQTN